MASHEQVCLLLSLPPELRNLIYNLLLVQQCQHPDAPWSSPEVRSPNRICANILSTCKQINAEGSPILYGQNTFSAHQSLLTAFPALLMQLYPRPRTLPPVLLPRPLSMIRRYHIYVRLDTDPQYDKEKIRDSFSGVEELEIQVYQSAYGSCDFSVLELFEDVRGVDKARVRGSIGDGQYTTWLETAMMSGLGVSIPPYRETPSEWSFWADGNR